MRVICGPSYVLPASLNDGVDYFSLYTNPGIPGVGTIAPGWKRALAKRGLAPSVAIWDFVSLALAVAAADLSCQRAKSSDGWTRQIELDVFLHDPKPWVHQRKELESAFRFLTGDFWTIRLLPGGEPPPQTTAPLECDADCVSLLSGGVDSLVGAIDLTSQGREPLFVSQVAKGDAKTQSWYAKALGGQARHFQWNHRIRSTHQTERSTRGRSIVFFAFALLASAVVPKTKDGTVDIFVPENGFISLNVPLNPGRFGSFSTKTTHPIFLQGIQAIWDTVGIPAKLKTPYQFLTKGELLASCADQQLLQKLIGESTSCGRFGYYGYTHCGRCVPCLVRRASFIKAGIVDSTPLYRFDDLKVSGRKTGANDIGAVAAAYLRYQMQGITRFAGGSLSFADLVHRPQYEGVVERGLDELGMLLKEHGVI